jgi:hypothetical protein
MSILDTENKIRIVKPHYADSKQQKTLEFAIPKELAERYKLNNETYLTLTPQEDSFLVRRLVIPEPGEDPNQ